MRLTYQYFTSNLVNSFSVSKCLFQRRIWVFKGQALELFDYLVDVGGLRVPGSVRVVGDRGIPVRSHMNWDLHAGSLHTAVVVQVAADATRVGLVGWRQGLILLGLQQQCLNRDAVLLRWLRSGHTRDLVLREMVGEARSAWFAWCRRHVVTGLCIVQAWSIDGMWLAYAATLIRHDMRVVVPVLLRVLKVVQNGRVIQFVAQSGCQMLLSRIWVIQLVVQSRNTCQHLDYGCN